jgi:hypothetical protein
MENFKKNCRCYIKQGKMIIKNHYHIYERNIEDILLYRLTEEEQKNIDEVVAKICIMEFYKEVLENIPEVKLCGL